MTARYSVFLQALGDEARLLRPEVREYAAGPPDGFRTGHGRGIFEIAGSRYRRFASLLRVFSGPGVMLSAYERDVPFQIVNRPTRESSRPGLEAERCFEFRRGRQRFVDVLRVGLLPGTLVNTMGRDGRIDVLLKCSVTPDGSLRLRSRAARIRIGPKKFTLPRIFSVKAEAIEGWDAKSERHTISVHVRNPLVGTVLRYRGSFKYEYVR